MPSLENPQGQGVEGREANATHQNEGGQQKNWRRYFGKEMSAWWTALFTGVLTLFTLGLVILTNNANDTAVVTQRAFLTVSSFITGVKVIKDGKIEQINFTVSVVNGGPTPSKSVLGRVNIQPWSAELPPSFDFRDLNNARDIPAVIGPHDGGRFDAVALNLDDLTAIKDKGHHVYTWGWITYRDAFKRTPLRLTEFCFEFTNIKVMKPNSTAPILDIFDTSNEFAWESAPCPVPHNCYDEDCKDYAEKAVLPRPN